MANSSSKVSRRVCNCSDGNVQNCIVEKADIKEPEEILGPPPVYFLQENRRTAHNLRQQRLRSERIRMARMNNKELRQTVMTTKEKIILFISLVIMVVTIIFIILIISRAI